MLHLRETLCAFGHRVGCGEALSLSIEHYCDQQPTTACYFAASIGLIICNHEYSHASRPLHRPTDLYTTSTARTCLSQARPTHASLILGSVDKRAFASLTVGSVNKRSFKASKSPFAPQTMYNPGYATVPRIIVCTEQQPATPWTSRYLKNKLGRG